MARQYFCLCFLMLQFLLYNAFPDGNKRKCKPKLRSCVSVFLNVYVCVPGCLYTYHGGVGAYRAQKGIRCPGNWVNVCTGKRSGSSPRRASALKHQATISQTPWVGSAF